LRTVNVVSSVPTGTAGLSLNLTTQRSAEMPYRPQRVSQKRKIIMNGHKSKFETIIS